MKKMTSLAIGTLMGTLAFSAQAVIVNGDFETGNLNGWTATVPFGGSAGAVLGGVGGIAPNGGSYMAQLKTDGPGSQTTLTQSIHLNMNDTASGFVNWYDAELANNQPNIFNDNVWVNILDSGGSLVSRVFYDQHAGNTSIVNGWEQWSFSAAYSGTYTIEFGIQNIGDSAVDSFAYFDDNSVEAPEPGILALLGLGLAGLGFRRRFKA